jgi:peroxiredoxin
MNARVRTPISAGNAGDFSSLEELPDDLPEPGDDGAADHLHGAKLPALTLRTTVGQVRMDQLADLALVFVHPSIGMAPHLLREWTAIPGARGCTAEACSFRGERQAFEQHGVQLLGLSGQRADRQLQTSEKLGLQYPLVSDEELALESLLGLPTFEFHGRRYYRRVTLIVRREIIAGVIYPVFPPDAAATQALTWLDARRGRRSA